MCAPRMLRPLPLPPPAMRRRPPPLTLLLLPLLLGLASARASSASPGDTAAMHAVAASLGADKPPLSWSPSTDPCSWSNVRCDDSGRVSSIQAGNCSLSGTLDPSIGNLSALVRLELQNNAISGALPTLPGSLQFALLHHNFFGSLPAGFFDGMDALAAVYLDENPFAPWPLPILPSAMVNFSANTANVTGSIPANFTSQASSLSEVALAYNNLSGVVPPSAFAGTLQLTTLWLNNQNARLSGSIGFIAGLNSLRQLWLHSNDFSGPLPDMSNLTVLSDLQLRDNELTGPVPASLLALPALNKVTLTNNLLQGPAVSFPKGVDADLVLSSESFCTSNVGTDCDPRVDMLLDVAGGFGYPVKLAQGWKGNNPCNGWVGITCNAAGNVTVINLRGMGLTGVISPAFANFTSLQTLLLANNNLSGMIPVELAALPALSKIDVSDNNLYGQIPPFRQSVIFNASGNPYIGQQGLPSSPSGSNATSGSGSGNAGPADGSNRSKNTVIGAVVGSIVGILLICLVTAFAIYWYKRKQQTFGRVQSPNATVIHPRRSGSDPDVVKITIAGGQLNGSAGNETISHTSSGPSEVHVVETRNMVISIHVLREVTNNFSEANILGRGGFGTVYKGELHDGTMIAVKRMEAGVMGNKGLDEFKSEIAVLDKVRHRNLVTLLGYCVHGNEHILVYEYMPQGALSKHLFGWKEENAKPLEWKLRIRIALDVARGVEYLHSLANETFIHRDLKPSNILLTDNMNAKVSDFGLVRLVPGDGKGISVQTRVAGTFGYLAPEYAAMGRVTTKSDVYSFGVILMELITGRKALDETQPEERVHLVTWFRRAQLNKDTFQKAIDPDMQVEEVALASVNAVAELAMHCTVRDPRQRPDMGHAVNVLSNFVEVWKPSDPDPDDITGIMQMTLPQALKKWQEYDDSSCFAGSTASSYIASLDNTQTSIPARPAGFADSFTSSDAR